MIILNDQMREKKGEQSKTRGERLNLKGRRKKTKQEQIQRKNSRKGQERVNLAGVIHVFL